MKKISLLILSAALLASCGGASSTSKSSSVEPEPSSSSIAESDPVESVSSSEESVTSMDLKTVESSEDITEESIESSEESSESSEESVESVESSEESIESIESSEEVKSQVVSFAASSGSGEHDAASLGELMIGDLIAEVGNISKIYKSAGAGGAHANEEGVIKTGTAKANGTMTITCTEPVKSISFVCHDFYKPSEQYPTNSNKIIINGVEKLAPYNTDAVGEDLEFVFDEPTDTINFEANRVYIWSLTIIA